MWVWEVLPGNEYDPLDVKHGHSQDVKCVAWHPTHQLIASCSYDNSIRLWIPDDMDWVQAQVLEGKVSGVLIKVVPSPVSCC